MGVSFQKELVVDRVQVYPPISDEKEEKDKLQVIKLQLIHEAVVITIFTHVVRPYVRPHFP